MISISFCEFLQSLMAFVVLMGAVLELSNLDV